jgi:16S rRNA processing protein RimM
LLENLVIIGKIISAYGIKGWVKIRPFTETAKNFIHYKTQFLSRNQKDWNRVEIKEIKIQGQDVIADIGLIDRDQSNLHKGYFLAIERNQLPQLPEDEFYWDDLIGLNVIDVDQLDLGKVVGLIETGANDVLVVSGDRERLIPYIPQVIKKVDTHNQLIEVDWDKEF